jgi:drug/metabolite transporter (DMT)-like permease
MFRLLIFSTIQCLFLVSSQIFLKFATAKIGVFKFTWEYIKDVLTNWELACSGICIVAATFLWMYILKHFEFSVAYPMISISYVFGMLASIFIFHEVIPMHRWLGVLLIMIGAFIVAKP